MKGRILLLKKNILIKDIVFKKEFERFKNKFFFIKCEDIDLIKYINKWNDKKFNKNKKLSIIIKNFIQYIDIVVY